MSWMNVGRWKRRISERRKRYVHTHAYTYMHTQMSAYTHIQYIVIILQHKLELENQSEEEKTRIEFEKIDLEKKNAVLETKVKQLGEQSKILYRILLNR